MLDKNASKPSIDLSDLGGRQISGPFAPEKPSTPIDLSDLGGIRIGPPQTNAPEESKDGEA
jgi:hypothetical protein